MFYDDDYDYLQHLKDVDELYAVEPVEAFTLQKSPSQDVSDKKVGGKIYL